MNLSSFDLQVSNGALVRPAADARVAVAAASEPGKNFGEGRLHLGKLAFELTAQLLQLVGVNNEIDRAIEVESLVQMFGDFIRSRCRGVVHAVTVNRAEGERKKKFFFICIFRERVGMSPSMKLISATDLLVGKQVRATQIDDLKTGEKAKALRKSAMLTAATVAHFLGISAAYLCDLEKGRRRWSESLSVRYQEAVAHLRAASDRGNK